MNSTDNSATQSTPKRRAQARKAEHTLRWVLAHEPPAVFEEASRVFVDLLREKTDGDIDVELMLGGDYAASSGNPASHDASWWSA